MQKIIIFKAILWLLLIYLVYRFISPLLYHYLASFFDQNSDRKNIDMDTLIRNKELLLRQGLQEKQKIDQEDTSKQSFNLMSKKYQEICAAGNSQYKEVLELLDEVQWGEGKHLVRIKEKLLANFTLEYSTSAISSKLKFICSREYPLLKGEELLTYTELVNLSLVFCLQQNLLTQTINQRGQLLSRFANQFKLVPYDIALGHQFFILENMGKSRKQAIQLTLQQTPIPQNLQVFENFVAHQSIETNIIEWFLAHLQLHSDIMAGLKEVPLMKKKDSLEEACEILGVSSNISLENLKKLYKKQARLRHPDALAAKNIPPEFEQSAQQNFVRIKEAYELLLKKLS